MYKPKHLKLWTLPDSYFGASWPQHYVFLTRHRDSDALSRANFDAALKELGGEQTADDDQETVLVGVIHESHWAVGWVEWIAIHQTAESALRAADEIMERLDDYPVVDEELFCEYEDNEAQEVWKNCYSPLERLEYIREHRTQFDFNSIADMRAVIRGEYFNGYASELIG